MLVVWFDFRIVLRQTEEINIEHVEQDLLKRLHIVMTYGEKTQRNCVGYPSVRSSTERGKSSHRCQIAGGYLAHLC
jgi:hypothetical protein